MNPSDGEANMLVRLIERRFGDVPPHLRQRIFAADVATLEEWAIASSTRWVRGMKYSYVLKSDKKAILRVRKRRPSRVDAI